MDRPQEAKTAESLKAKGKAKIKDEGVGSGTTLAIHLQRPNRRRSVTCMCELESVRLMTAPTHTSLTTNSNGLLANPGIATVLKAKVNEERAGADLSRPDAETAKVKVNGTGQGKDRDQTSGKDSVGAVC